MYTQVGNAVPVLLAKAVGNHFLEFDGDHLVGAFGWFGAEA